MGKKKKKSFKPFCWYCDREFDSEEVLIQHQKQRHFKCSECQKKLSTASGMAVHVWQVHNIRVDKVPNAIEGKDSLDLLITGMDGVPEDDPRFGTADVAEEPSKKAKADGLPVINPLTGVAAGPAAGVPFTPPPGAVVSPALAAAAVASRAAVPPQPTPQPNMMPNMPMMGYPGMPPGMPPQWGRGGPPFMMPPMGMAPGMMGFPPMGMMPPGMPPQMMPGMGLPPGPPNAPGLLQPPQAFAPPPPPHMRQEMVNPNPTLQQPPSGGLFPAYDGVAAASSSSSATPAPAASASASAATAAAAPAAAGAVLMIYDDPDISPEERRASLRRYSAGPVAAQ